METSLKILSMNDATAFVGGWGVVFGGRDLVRETLTADTDFMKSLVPEPLLFYDHALRDVVDPIGRVTKMDFRENGIWIEAEIERAKEYAEEVLRLIGSGLMGLSSGSVAHLVRKSTDGIIKRWPTVEFSVTPTPAEPRTVGVERLKTLIENTPGLAAMIEYREVHRVDVIAEKTLEPTMETEKMEEFKSALAEMQAKNAAEMSALQAKNDELSQNINRVLSALEKSPAAEDAGMISNYGGTADQTHKSLGDFMLAVRRHDAKRLKSVYNIKDLTEADLSSGGAIVPTEYSQTLYQMEAEQSQIINRVTVIQARSVAGAYPALDQFTAPTAGSGATSMAAGATVATTPEGGAFTETNISFSQISWRLNKVGGMIQASTELVEDTPQSLDQLLRSIFVVAISNKNERNIIRGTGTGEPIGILNATCAIGVTPASNNAFGEADALNMLSRFKPITGRIVWLMHRGVIPDFANFSASNADLVDWNTTLRGSLLGYPIVYSEHLPQDDNSGDVILADMGAYLLFRGPLTVDFSEHYAFANGLGTWRFYERNDGKAWLQNAITLADPQGSYTVSPFVYHND